MVAEDANSDLRLTLEAYLNVADDHLKHFNADVDRVLVSPTPVAWDGGCDGQLWTRIATFAPVEGTNARCGVSYWIATIGVGVIRRIATVANNGAPPRAEYVTQDALNQANDMRILKDALMSVDTTRQFVSWTPLAPQGGYAGGEWLINVRVPNIIRSITTENQ